MLKRYKLMIPGPVEVAPELLAETGKPMVAHYGGDWAGFYHETVDLLKHMMGAENAQVFPIAGPGSAALDAAIGSTLGDGKKALVLSNGFFGERLRQIASAYLPQDQVRVLGADVGEPITGDRVEEALKREGDIGAVVLVHCETSTSVLNPVREIAQVCDRHGAFTIVDAITSLGGAEFRFDEWGIGACVTTTQKCLGLPPGIAPVAVSNRVWEALETAESPGWYLNLRTWKGYLESWGDWHPHPTTMPTGLMQALHLGLERILNEGLQARWKRHERAAALLRAGLQELGFEMAAREGYRSPTVTAVWALEGLSATDLIAGLRDDHGILISGALGELKGRMFRIGHMGETACIESIASLLLAVEDVLRSAGRDIGAGQSLKGLDLPF